MNPHTIARSPLRTRKASYSRRVLEKCGFAQVRESHDNEVGRVWEWELL